MSADLQTTLDRIPFDDETLVNLAAADPHAMRAMLSKYLPDEEVEAILERIKSLVAERG